MTKNDIIIMRKKSCREQHFDKRRLKTLLRETFASTNLVRYYGFSEVETLINNIVNNFWEELR